MKSCQTSWKLASPPRWFLPVQLAAYLPKWLAIDQKRSRSVSSPVVDINLSRAVHFAELESGVFAAFQALISPRDRRGGGKGRKRSLRGMASPFATMQIIGCRTGALWKKKRRVYIYIWRALNMYYIRIEDRDVSLKRNIERERINYFIY